jgi:hypothetical protein
MKQYGLEAERAREMMRTEIVWAHEQFWGDAPAMAAAYEASYRNMGSMSDFLNGLNPSGDKQKQLLAAANQHYAAICVLALGAASVASAIFLILELSQPYTSLLRISPAGLEQVIVDLDK